jgi:hypothetical protein
VVTVVFPDWLIHSQVFPVYLSVSPRRPRGLSSKEWAGGMIDTGVCWWKKNWKLSLCAYVKWLSLLKLAYGKLVTGKTHWQCGVMREPAELWGDAPSRVHMPEFSPRLSPNEPGSPWSPRALVTYQKNVTIPASRTHWLLRAGSQNTPAKLRYCLRSEVPPALSCSPTAGAVGATLGHKPKSLLASSKISSSVSEKKTEKCSHPKGLRYKIMSVLNVNALKVECSQIPKRNI